MKKGYYLTVYSEDFLGVGILNKINTQLNCFANHNINISIYSLSRVKNTLIHRALKRLPYFSTLVHYKYDELVIEADFLYLRYHGANYSMIKFLKKVKKKNPNIKILLEIPTYPYEKEEMMTLSNFTIIAKDRYNRRKLYKYIDRLVLIGDKEYKKLFHIPVINMINGIEFDDFKLKKPSNSKKLNMICVSRFSKWHGIDILIKSLSEYIVKKDAFLDIIIHLVGDGPEIPRYKELVEELQLNKYIIFDGVKKKKELDNIYNEANIAIESLNRKETNLFISSSLKSREYLAKGLPIISGTEIDVIKDDFNYLLVLNKDFLFEEIIKFFNKIYLSNSEKTINEYIREYGKEKCDINITFSPVIEYIKN